jgi:hypothetical protein
MRYTPTITAIAIFALLLGGGGAFCFFEWQESVNAEAAATEELADVQSKRRATAAALKKTSADAVAPLEFVKAWETQFAKGKQDPLDISTAAVRLADANTATVSEKATTGNKDYGDTGLTVSSCTLRCQGEYDNLFNLLVELEWAFQTARFDHLVFSATEGRKTTQMEVTFNVPVDVAKKKTRAEIVPASLSQQQ